MMKQNFHIVVSVLASYLLLCFIFPDLFVFTRLSFIRFSDTEINFYGTFSLVSNLYHGGIQLWDTYNQMPLAYFYTAVSMLSFSTLWTAAIYSILAPFVSYPGVFFQVFYSRFYYLPAMVILCVGSYLLFRRFTRKPGLLLLLTIYTESLLVPQMYLGLNTESLFSFFPLLIHFILSFFEHGRFRDAVLAYCTFAVCVAMFPLIAIGYFYQGVHFTVLPMIAWWLMTRRTILFRRSTLSHAWRVLRTGAKQRHRQGIMLGMAVFTVLLLLPHMVLLKTTYHTYDIAQDASRFAKFNPFRPLDYFSRTDNLFYADQSEILQRVLNFDDNYWAYSWVFLGTVAVFLSFCGLILSHDSRKYIFGGAALCFWLLNSPKVTTGWQSTIHWVNAFTNPFNVAVRSMHMTGALMLPLILAPLVAMGLVSLCYPRKDPIGPSIIKGTAIAMLLGLVVQSALLRLPTMDIWYPQIGFGVCSMLLIVRLVGFRGFRLILGVLLLFLVLVDGYAMHHYMKLVADQMDIMEHRVAGLPEPIILDYQNPLVLPFRQYTNSSFVPDFQPYLAENPHNSREQFLRYTNYKIYFVPPDQYHARHVSYSRLAWDGALQQYLFSVKSFITQFPVAIPQQESSLAAIQAKNMDHQVVLINEVPALPGIVQASLDAVTPGVYNQPLPPMKSVTLSLAGYFKEKRNHTAFYVLPMPEDMPKTLATGVFTADRQLIAMSAGNREVVSVQGFVRSPYTFDVQNMVTGHIVVGLPVGNQDASVRLSYAVPSGEGIGTVYTYQPDIMDFDYHMNMDGWMVLHMPYDPKWSVQIDGVSQRSYRANYSFLGLPLSQGTHRIQLSYWPNWWIRSSLATTMLLIMFSPGVIIWFALRYCDSADGR